LLLKKRQGSFFISILFGRPSIDDIWHPSTLPASTAFALSLLFLERNEAFSTWRKWQKGLPSRTITTATAAANAPGKAGKEEEKAAFNANQVGGVELRERH